MTLLTISGLYAGGDVPEGNSHRGSLGVIMVLERTAVGQGMPGKHSLPTCICIIGETPRERVTREGRAIDQEVYDKTLRS